MLAVPKPSAESHTFMRCLNDIGEYQVVPGGDPLLMSAGDIYVLPFDRIAELVLDHQSELI